MDKRFKEADTKMDAGFAKVDEKFDKVDERFEKVDKKFDKVDKRFDKTDAKMDRGFTEVRELFLKFFAPNQKTPKASNPDPSSTQASKPSKPDLRNVLDASSPMEKSTQLPESPLQQTGSTTNPTETPLKEKLPESLV